MFSLMIILSLTLLILVYWIESIPCIVAIVVIVHIVNIIIYATRLMCIKSKEYEEWKKTLLKK
mgnify:CR=1 FL=1